MCVEVAWLDQNSIPLTYEERRVIDDSRFSVVRTLVRDWNLQLQDVQLDDAGVYRCTVNTKPIGIKVVSLHVTGNQLASLRFVHAGVCALRCGMCRTNQIHGIQWECSHRARCGAVLCGIVRHVASFFATYRKTPHRNAPHPV